MIPAPSTQTGTTYHHPDTPDVCVAPAIHMACAKAAIISDTPRVTARVVVIGVDMASIRIPQNTAAIDIAVRYHGLVFTVPYGVSFLRSEKRKFITPIAI